MRKFDKLVNDVARDMDADCDYNETVAIAMDCFGASRETADKVARELGRKPEVKAYSIKKEGPRHWRVLHKGKRTSYSGDTFAEAEGIVRHLTQTGDVK
jgi:hypothetical protein